MSEVQNNTKSTSARDGLNALRKKLAQEYGGSQTQDPMSIFQQIMWQRQIASSGTESKGATNKSSSNGTSNPKNFDECLKNLLIDEGGYNAELDGGTNMGILQSTYDSYMDSIGQAHKDVSGITKEEVTKIYKQNYWDASNCSKMKDPRVAYIIFDRTVLGGPGYTNSVLSKAGLTREQVENSTDDATVKKLLNASYDLVKNSSQSEYIEGWTNRLDRVSKRINVSSGMNTIG